MNWLEVSLIVDGELAEAITDIFARHDPSGVVAERDLKRCLLYKYVILWHAS